MGAGSRTPNRTVDPAGARASTVRGLSGVKESSKGRRTGSSSDAPGGDGTKCCFQPRRGRLKHPLEDRYESSTSAPRSG